MSAFSFNDVDMGSYDLELMSYQKEIFQETESLQVLERAWGLTSRRPLRQINLNVVIKGDNISDLMSNLDNIKLYLNRTDDCKLEIDTITDRYWMARFGGMSEEICLADIWKGSIIFYLFDPMAYASTESDNDHSIS